MNCRHVERLLSDQNEGLLPEREARALAAHLEACPACRRRQEAFHAIGTELRALTELSPPLDLARRSVARWETEQQAQAWPGRLWFLSRPALAPLAATVVLLAVVLVFAMTRQGKGLHPNHSTMADGAPLFVKESSPGSEEPPLRLHKDGLRPRKSPDIPLQRRDDTTPHFAVAPTANINRAIRSRPVRLQDDLAYLNSTATSAPWTQRDSEKAAQRTAQREQKTRKGDDFVFVPFPRLASKDERALAEAKAAYQRERAVVDARLARKMTLAVKAISFADLCKQWRDEIGIEFSAARSVADDKATIFCRQRPLRDIMRQITQVFGFQWRRSGKPEQYQYELFQDLRSQLLEEELRNRDRNEALIALDREMERYRKYRDLSPEEAKEKAAATAPEDKELLDQLAGHGWGPAQLYFNLSPDQLMALRNGQQLDFHSAPDSGQMLLPPDMTSGILQSLGDWRISTTSGGLRVGPAKEVPDGQPPAAMPGAQAIAFLRLDHSDLGQFNLVGGSGFTYSVSKGPNSKSSVVSMMDDPIASSISPSAQNPDNKTANAKLARDPALERRITLQPKESCRLEPDDSNPEKNPGGPRVTIADVLETVHQESGLDIVADAFTRLYAPQAVTVRNASLFDALNRISDTMRLHWTKSAGGLHFRSVIFFNDRLKEVPNHLLARWAESRRQNGRLTADDLMEVAQLTDAQLNAQAMAEGARACYGLKEWKQAADSAVRPHWRFLAGLSPNLRQAAWSEKGLSFGQMSVSQQQNFLALLLNKDRRIRAQMEDMTEATMRVKYPTPDAPNGEQKGGGTKPTVKFTYHYGGRNIGHTKREVSTGSESISTDRADAQLP